MNARPQPEPETEPTREPATGAVEVPSFGDLDRSASFLLRIAQVSTYEAIFASDIELPLTLPELTVLAAIEANPDARQGAIADALKIKWPHMTKLVRGLETRGLVERFVPAEDRRSVFLRLTPAGQALRDEMAPKMRRIDDIALGMLTDAERAQLLPLLRKISGWAPSRKDGEDAK